MIWKHIQIKHELCFSILGLEDQNLQGGLSPMQGGYAYCLKKEIRIACVYTKI